jgi:flagellar motor protein MotB
MAGSLQNNHPGSRIAIAVHTDNLALPKDSKFTSEQELSDAQAKAVLEDLVQDGMDANSLTATGYGSSYPIKSNDTEAERARNRRVHFILLKAKPGDGEAALKKPAISGPAPESTSESPAPKP